MTHPVYPFAAIVGQQKMKLALLLNVIYPEIGGVLIRGHRGTAKSTAVRGLVNVMPFIRVVSDCPFHCDPENPQRMCDRCLERFEAGEVLDWIERPSPLVNLPIGATEDRLLGSLDLERALSRGERRFEPGLLAEANRALFYVDEVNLLNDHLVDLLLDAAAMGVNFVEREGLSFSHPSRFVLIGTMNPEEGDLRPQLLDRFGLCVEVSGSKDAAERSAIARRRLRFESEPAKFAEQWAAEERKLSLDLAQATERLKHVTVPDEIWELAARFSLSFETEGHRSDITMVKAAMALSALNGTPEVTSKELVQAAELALPHRFKKHGLRHAELNVQKLETLAEAFEEEKASPETASGHEKKKLTLV
ncbi:MAG: ATP-binding protein [Deltaproteobacteria bacterium]|nr:ATP-binding protein [Deltaproteobacteria bacterium]